MKIRSGALAIALAAAGTVASSPVHAGTSVFATQPEAQQACGADEVVWVDLDRGRFYHQAQPNFGKSHNGGYACMKAAHAQYRESHD